ncbi:hypothetical protein [Streptomyces sp. NPDC048057]|uniref:hypothetical protein n=1 Tax=Streptomyces sp. NPDC048057 TaxID=3155628 RepID=UPI0033C54F97
MIRTRVWAAAVTTAAGLALTTAVPANATSTSTPTTVPWAVSHGSEATASGDRWIERGSTPRSGDLVLKGTLTNTGSGCYSVWTQYIWDRVVKPPTKYTEICGPGTVNVDIREALPAFPIYSGSVKVCKGTAYTRDCGRAESITSWPIQR